MELLTEIDDPLAIFAGLRRWSVRRVLLASTTLSLSSVVGGQTLNPKPLNP